ncbi:lysylphosphatidylglycerol synthase transmembrane domain-containing protein [Flagellimonas allohymeniacidonis]|uniref:Flippase-like domain-containing protein n=1 Tax=Flagellimonas allohymeniacidonis TaxID=2517819 RepID=A0A4Q8QHF7_9FLAO|nr:lysylphosphatidylglycerol synthase transmembrane domain-containing protein [Allomuricauda hymeniacidonis]TAI49374.1 flippase-like domain-containing protein [Allomuricauda hymeniacidonis]
MQERRRKQLLTILKIVVSGVLIYFIFTKINFQDVVRTLKTSNPFYLIGGILLVLFSKVMASFRLNLYFHQIGAKLTTWSNLKLYFLGMFYNLFLPGGIGGDAYKGYIIQKSFKPGTKKVVGVLLIDRLSGLLLLFIYACILSLVLNNDFIAPYKPIFAVAIPLSIAAFWWMNKRFFLYALPIFWNSFLYSALVQFSQMVCVILILLSLDVHMTYVEYLLVFLVSSIVSVIPLTIGGIGSREVTFLYGAQWLALEANTAIGVSFVFFLMTALISFIGIRYHFEKPKLEVVDS